MTRWLVTGASGLLGRDLTHALDSESLTAATRDELDITNPVTCRDVVAASVGAGDVVINAAAWTDIDSAEMHQAQAYRVNATGVGNLVAACAAVGARLIHVSTDCVFAGRAEHPYAEDATPAPVNAYGRSKLAGEHAVLRGLPEHGYVVRTAWLYGAWGRCFPRTLLRLAEEREIIEVVDDQRGAPSWSGALARQIAALGRAAPRAGIYHGTAAGTTTWYGFACALFDERGLDRRRLRPVGSDRFPRPAPRPAYSVLGHRRWAATSIAALPHWRAMLSTAAADVFAGEARYAPH